MGAREKFSFLLRRPIADFRNVRKEVRGLNWVERDREHDRGYDDPRLAGGLGGTVAPKAGDEESRSGKLFL